MKKILPIDSNINFENIFDNYILLDFRPGSYAINDLKKINKNFDDYFIVEKKNLIFTFYYTIFKGYELKNSSFYSSIFFYF
jgi:hypothetical protein